MKMMKKTLNILEFDKIKNILVSYASNEFGIKLAEELKPEGDIEKVKPLYDELSEALFLYSKQGNPSLSGLVNLSHALKVAEAGGNMSMAELLGVAANLKIARNLIKYYNSETPKEEILKKYFDELTENKQIENKINTAIISEEQMADGASPALAEIRRHKLKTHASIREHLDSIVHSTKYRKFLQEAIVTVRDGRYVVPVKSENRSEIGGIVHDMSATGSTVFVEPNAVVEANNKLRELEGKEQAEIERILAELTAEVSEIVHELFVNQRVIGKLDFIFAKAKMSVSLSGTIPFLNDRGYINIINGRHPLLDRAKVVPISINIGDSFRTLVITGSNTGGKTVSLKTVGLFCVMASCGLGIPASSGTELCIFENIFADIGDEQSIEQSLSTFSAHMTTIVEILKNITPNTLVLFDELGAGTDPTEGAALAVAILKHVYSQGAVTVATTHYSEIKMYALTTDGIENASCEFDEKSLKPTYRIIQGIPGKSNAFLVSKRLGLPEFIIKSAEEHLSSDSIHFEDVLTELEKSRIDAEKAKETAEKLKTDTEKMKREISEEKKRISKKHETAAETARKEAKKIIEQAKQEADKIINEIKEAERKKDRKELNKAITDAKTKLNKKLREVSRPEVKKTGVNHDIPEKLIAGDTVYMIDIEQNGTVITPPKADGNVVIQAGIMKVTSHISNLRLVNEKSVEVKANTSGERVSKLRSNQMSNEIDLRGNTLDDALIMTEKYIDDAYMSGLKEIRIIHGKGTGVLRSGIQSMLKKNQLVKSYRLGTFGEGETGVTVAELK